MKCVCLQVDEGCRVRASTLRLNVVFSSRRIMTQIAADICSYLRNKRDEMVEFLVKRMNEIVRLLVLWWQNLEIRIKQHQMIRITNPKSIGNHMFSKTKI